MAYRVVCKACGTESRIAQARGVRMADYACACGGRLRRIGWQEMYRAYGRMETAAQAAVAVLRDSGNPAIGWGDSGLLHAVAERLGMPHEGLATERKVLDRIERSHAGVLIKRYKTYSGRGLSRLREYIHPEDIA